MDQYSLRDLYQELEIKLIKSLVKNLNRWLKEVSKLGKIYEPWQVGKLRALKKFRKENKNLIASYDEITEETIDKVLKGAYINNLNKNNLNLIAPIKEMTPKRANQEIDELPNNELSFFLISNERMKVMINEVQQEFKNVNRNLLNRINSTEGIIMSEALIKLQTGTVTYKQATEEATKKLIDNGLKSVVYKDGSKRSPSTYAEMVLRTGYSRAKFIADGEKRARDKNYYVISTVHVNCCPKCKQYQGKIMIDDVFMDPPKDIGTVVKKEFNTEPIFLSNAMKNGFLHPNCRHNLVTYIPGITIIPKPLTKEEEKEALERYEQEQKQRKIERYIRKLKKDREIASNKKIIDKKILEANKALKAHIKQFPYLRRDYWRERNG